VLFLTSPYILIPDCISTEPGLLDLESLRARQAHRKALSGMLAHRPEDLLALFLERLTHSWLSVL
jgi:hypothetical protein